MLTDTEGIVLRQIKTSYNRKMVRLFTRSYGKISAGTGIGERGKSKGALAVRPFTYGRYELFKGRDSYNINSAEVIKSFYGIGENVEKYMQGAYVLEFTEKALPEEMPAQALFDLLIEFFKILERREKGLGTLVLAYQIKLLKLSGNMPALGSCVICGKEKKADHFSVENGGIVCDDCVKTLGEQAVDTLIYCDKFDIVNVLDYLAKVPLGDLENIALNEENGKLLQKIVRQYAACHLDITDIKSEELV